jgi:metal-dependent amidase/aminoacylase/carboxypeptidase family protein
MCGITFPAGTAVVSGAGVSAPAADFFEIRIKGKGCHGSSPNLGIDPLTAAAHTVLALQELHARELAMDDRAALTIGSFHAGKAANAIPDTAVLSGTLRTFDEELRRYIKQRLQDIVYHTCAAFLAQLFWPCEASKPQKPQQQLPQLYKSEYTPKPSPHTHYTKSTPMAQEKTTLLLLIPRLFYCLVKFQIAVDIKHVGYAENIVL